MTTSGTYLFDLPADDAATEAWERCGKSPDILNGSVARSIRRSLFLMLIDWTNRKVPLWQVEKITTTLAAAQLTWTAPSRVVDILDCTITQAGIDRNVVQVGRSDYSAISNKNVPGPPSQIWVQRVIPAPIVTFYPVPDVPYVFTALCLRQPQDVSALAQTPEVPLLWYEALCAGLAARLAVKYAPERLVFLTPLAAEAFGNASGENRERVPMTILPDMGGY